MVCGKDNTSTLSLGYTCEAATCCSRRTHLSLGNKSHSAVVAVVVVVVVLTPWRNQIIQSSVRPQTWPPQCWVEGSSQLHFHARCESDHQVEAAGLTTQWLSRGVTTVATTSKMHRRICQLICILDSASQNGALYQKWVRSCLRHASVSFDVRRQKSISGSM